MVLEADAPDTSIVLLDPDPPVAGTNWLQHHHEGFYYAPGLQVRAKARRIPQPALPRYKSPPCANSPALAPTCSLRRHRTRSRWPSREHDCKASTGGLSLFDQQPHRACFIGRWGEHGLGLDRQPSRPQPQRTIVNTTRVVSRWRDPSPYVLTGCNETLWTASRICRLHLSYVGHIHHIHHIPCNEVRCYLQQLCIAQIQDNDTVSRSRLHP